MKLNIFALLNNLHNRMKIYSVCISIAFVLFATFCLFTNFTIPFSDNENADNQPTTQTPHVTYMPLLPDSADFCGERVPLERADVREALEREMICNSFLHSATALNLKRSHRYFPQIEAIMKECGIPDDFKYLCVAESNLMPTVKSPAGAVGLWQIMEATGKELGLEVGTEVDERYSLEMSTRAACRFLLQAYEQFGSWTLVAASYNGGKRRVSNNLRDQQQQSYYDVLWGEETGRYVYRIIALKYIMQQPELYGFNLTSEEYYEAEPSTVDTVRTSVDNWTDYALEHGTTYKALKRLNPWLRTQSLTNTKARTYLIALPATEPEQQ